MFSRVQVQVRTYTGHTAGLFKPYIHCYRTENYIYLFYSFTSVYLHWFYFSSAPSLARPNQHSSKQIRQNEIKHTPHNIQVYESIDDTLSILWKKIPSNWLYSAGLRSRIQIHSISLFKKFKTTTICFQLRNEHISVQQSKENNFS